jgi:hypothetical protein
MFGRKLFITIVVLTSTLTDSCAIFKHGRVGVTIDGLSDKCCSNMSPVFDDIMKKAEKEGDAFENSDEMQAAQQQAMTTFLSNCCSDSDQGVFGTLVPSEPADAAGQIQQMCAMMEPHNADPDVLELFGIAPLLRHGGLLAAPKTTSALPSMSLGLAAAIGAFAGGAVVTSVMVLKFGKTTKSEYTLLG